MESSNLLIDVGLQMRKGRDSQPVIGVGRGHSRYCSDSTTPLLWLPNTVLRALPLALEPDTLLSRGTERCSETRTSATWCPKAQQQF